MSISRNNKIPVFKPQKDLDIRWPNFNGGLNTLFKPTELRPNELAQADNIMFVGMGIPTGRWGTNLYFQAGEAGSIRLLDAYYNSNTSTNLLLAITDSGYLVQKTNASYTIITGASFPSGYNLQSLQLANNTYIAAASQNFIRFDGSNLIPYNSISPPTNVSVAQISAASGFTTWSWIITANSLTGETLGSTAKVLASLPLDLTTTSIKVSWNALSNASIMGYNIYRGFQGQETLLATTGPDTTQIYDNGAKTGFIQPPLSDTTAGIKAKYILKINDRILLAGIAGDPSRVYISGRYPYHDRFSAIDGGGYTYISPNDGDDITGIQITGNQFIGGGIGTAGLPNVLVFKNNSVHRITFNIISLGNFNILDFQTQVLTTSSGASSGDAVVLVENDSYYFGVKGLYSIGMQQAFLNQIRSNELSFRVRDYVRGLSQADYKNAAAVYIDNKYLVSFPSRKEILLYDVQRNAFAKWITSWGITRWLRYFDGSGTEIWLGGTDNSVSTPQVMRFSPSYVSDNGGTAIAKIIRTRKEDMGNWPVFKVLKLFYVLFRNIQGNINVNIRIEDKTGNTVQTKSFTVSGSLGSGGWGNDQWGDQQWGQSNATVVVTGDELARYSLLFKNCRVVQVEITTTDANTQLEFLQVRMTAQSLGDYSLPSTDKV